MDKGNATQADPWYTYLFGWISASLVVVGSVLFVFVLLYILFYQLDAIETSSKVTPLSAGAISVASDMTPEKIMLIGQLYMESDAQFLRTERAQTLVGARLTVMIVAELVGLSLIVLGGAFIFARIRGAGALNAEPGSGAAAGKYSLQSNFPGLFLCAFGAIIVIWALEISVDENARIMTGDRPLFFPSASFPVPKPDAVEPGQGIKFILAENCKENAPDPAACAGSK